MRRVGGAVAGLTAVVLVSIKPTPAARSGLPALAGAPGLAVGFAVTAALAGVPTVVTPSSAAETGSRQVAAPSIGSATMLEDGTVLLHLRATGPGGVIGDALLRYPPSDPNYAAVRAHLPTLRPGDDVPVPPFE